MYSAARNGDHDWNQLLTSFWFLVLLILVALGSCQLTSEVFFKKQSAIREAQIEFQWALRHSVLAELGVAVVPQTPLFFETSSKTLAHWEVSWADSSFPDFSKSSSMLAGHLPSLDPGMFFSWKTWRQKNFQCNLWVCWALKLQLEEVKLRWNSEVVEILVVIYVVLCLGVVSYHVTFTSEKYSTLNYDDILWAWKKYRSQRLHGTGIFTY